MPIDEIEISANLIEKKPFSIQNNIKSNIYVFLFCFIARTDKVIVNWSETIKLTETRTIFKKKMYDKAQNDK